MKPVFKHFVAFVFVCVVLVQVYFGMAQTVEALQPANMVKSFRLSSLRDSSACNSFSIGDTLVLKASSEVAARYKVTILKEDVAIFETEGGYVNSSGEAKVSLNPPRFVVGIVYTAVLDSFSYNIPIIGVNYHDSKYAIFTVVETKTQLSVEVAYNGGFRSLKLVGNLTDVDGCPVFNETLLFEAKLYDRGRATDGWTPLGSSLTNESGIAEYTSALYVPDGNYSFRAFHNATSNFGESSDSKRISVSSNGTLVTGGNLAAASFDFEPDGWEEHGVFSFSPGVGQTTNALMYRKITVTYRTGLYFENGALVEFFYFDHFKPGQPDGNTTLTRTYDGSVYTYMGCMDWVPDSVGTFFFMAGISSISVLNLTRAILFGEFFDQGNSTLTVVPCPYSNVVLYSPMNNYDRSVRFTVALSKPRTYQTQTSGFFTSSALAPRVSYGGLEYTLDDPLSYYSIDVYVNGNDHVVTADQNGVATLSVVTSAGQDHLLYNITVAGPCGSVNDPVAPFRIQRWVNFTNVRVREVKSGADGSLSFNSSVVSYLQNETRFYVGLANSLQANVSLLGQPMWNASAQFIVTGGFLDVDLDRSSHGYHAIPSPRRDYLHVTAMSGGTSSLKELFIMAQFDNGPSQFLDSQDAVSVPQWSHNVTLWSRADINRDWSINVLDMIAVAGKSGQSGPPGWIAEDVNCDGTVNVLDLIAVSNHWGYVTATVEFSMTILVESVCTDGLGAALERWTPDQSSRYLVQIKLSSDYRVAVGRYVSTVSATAASNNLCYVDVLKRPVNLTLETTHFSQNRTVIAVAKAFDPIIGKPVSNLYLDLDSFFVFCKGSGVTNASGMIRWAFTPPADPPDGFAAYSCVYQLVSVSNETYLEGSLWGRIEFDMPTTITFQGPNPLSIGSGVNYNYDFFVGALGYQQFLKDYLLHFYIEGTFTDGTTFKYNPAAAQISADGHASFGWSFNYTGTYNVRADFEGVSGLFFGSECVVAVNASVWSLAVLFSVSKTEFAVGDGIRLNATIINMYTGTRLVDPNYVSVKFYDVTAAGESFLGSASTQNHNGVATFNLNYPTDGNAHAYRAKIDSGNNFLPQGMMSSTVQLTVRSPTNMLLNVSRNAHSQNYVFTGRLMLAGGGLGQQAIKLKVNDTEYNLSTNGTGFFSKSLDLQPNNNQATSYTISASFSGDSDVKNVTAWSYTLNSTRYAACSTTQYGYGPSSNSTSLVISPLGTEMTTVSVTLVDVKDTLKISTEFSWWYPWLKVVAEVNVPFDIGTTKFRFELMPIVFQQAAYVVSGEDALIDALIKIVATVGADAAIGFFLGTFIAPRIAARVACSSIINVAVVVALYAAVQIGVAIFLNKVFGKTGLAISVVSFFLSAVISAFMAGISHVSDWIRAIYRGATGQIKDIWHSWWGRDLGFVNIVEATAFFFVDVGLGAFMAGFM